jgi:hypothetical protein
MGVPRDTRGAYVRRKTRRGPHGLPAFVAEVIANPQRVWLLGVIALGFLLATGFWTNQSVKKTMRDFQSESLRTILGANVTALKIWAEDERSFVESHAADPSLADEVVAVLDLSRESPDSVAPILASDALRQLRKRFETVVPDEYVGFYVIDPGYRIVAAAEDEAVGRRLQPTSVPVIGPALEGKAILSNPIYTGREEMLAQRIIAAAPVRANNRVVAVLAFTVDPAGEFTSILSVGRLGKTGETYAFDGDGMMLSQSLYEQQLKDIGLLEDTPEATSSLHVELRDPGGNLVRGHRNEAPVGTWPLTKAVASAIQDGAGWDVRGYRDYRGVTVIGAWEWVEEYETGVVTEVDVQEAHMLLDPLRIAFWVLFGSTVFLTLAALFASHVVQRLSRGIDEVKQLGQYQLIRKIGEGGMGAVYLGRHAMLRRPTAIKLLKTNAMTTEGLARFEREVQLTSELTHPNTIVIYDYGRTPEDRFYYAMEYLTGITLAKLIDVVGGAVPAPRVLYILRHVCASLEEAHARGLVHRDIKPLNIMVCQRGLDADVVKVLDFGLVKDVDAPDSSLEVSSPNVIGGTPMYIAPERLKDPTVLDARADMYALGAVAFNLLTGQPLFPGGSPMEIGYYALNSPTPRPSDVTHAPIPPALDQLVYECLSKDPDDRPDDAGVMLNHLDAIHVDDPWTHTCARAWWAERPELIDGDGIDEVFSDSKTVIDA